MSFVELLRSGGFPLALEITPPRRHLPAVLRRRAAMLGERPGAINVIQRPGRQSSLDASLELRAAGFDPVWHVVNRGRTRGEIAADLERARQGGVRNLLCLRGDHEAADAGDTPKIRDVIAMAAEAIPGAFVGATMNQYLPPAQVLVNLMPKVEAGAAFVQTQPVFDPERLFAMAAALHERAPHVAVVPMVMPLRSVEAAHRMAQRLGIETDARLVARIEREGEAGGWAAFEETLRALRESDLVDAVAIMTMEMDPPEAFCARLCRAVDTVLG